MGIPGGECGFSSQRPGCPVLFDTRSRLNITRDEFLVVTVGTGGDGERSRHCWRRVFPQPVHSVQATRMVTVHVGRETPKLE